MSVPGPAVSPALVACQREGGAFLKSLRSSLVRCSVTPAEKVETKKKDSKTPAAAPATTFDVVLTDSVLFPEGGGQPTDTGIMRLFKKENGNETLICESKVICVIRTPLGAMHRIDSDLIAPLRSELNLAADAADLTTAIDSLPYQLEVETEVDWDRRFDNMQCHSSQHLISAVAKKTFGWPTMSWWLASYPSECHIEFGPSKLENATPEISAFSADQISSLEQFCNEWIRRGENMKLMIFDSVASARSDPYFASQMQKSLSNAQEGPLRVVEIKDLDFNPCCGTHLNNTSQMQMIKLTRVEKQKNGSAKVFFLTGSRTNKALGDALDVQKQVGTVLSCAPEFFADKAKKLVDETKCLNKQIERLLKEIVISDARSLLDQITSGSKVVSLHRDEAGLPYLGELADVLTNLLKEKNVTSPFIASVSSCDSLGGSDGAFLLFGDEAKVTELGAELATRLGGKGGGRKGRFQGKASKLDAASRSAAMEWMQTKM